MDGDAGSHTQAAITEFQQRVLGLVNPDGRVDPNGRTLRALTDAVSMSPPANLTARFEEVRFQGKRRQMMLGRITVNNTTYFFTSGGHGRGNLPRGQYTVTEHLRTRGGASYSVDGVGYSFAVSDVADPRVGGPPRTLLRIHPDGGSLGTNGCIGILGRADTQNSFRDNMYTELGRSGGSVTLTVQ